MKQSEITLRESSENMPCERSTSDYKKRPVYGDD